MMVCGALLSACANMPHNDVLIFGTQTVIAADISSSATNGGAPQITIGYKREEAVWLPLAQNCIRKTDAGSLQACQETGQLYQGKEPTSATEDAYSVFASMGAKLEGSAKPAQADGKVGLAQFFATGIAAQRLASNPIAALALSVKPDETGKAEASAASAVAINEAEKLGLALSENDAKEADVLFRCALANGNSIYKNIPAKASGNPALQQNWSTRIQSAHTRLAYQAMINSDDDFRTEALGEAKKAGCV